MPLTACPDAQSLGQLVIGLLDEDVADELERHISACASCADTLRNLGTRDDLIDALRGAAPVAVADAEVSAALSRMRKAPPLSRNAQARPVASAGHSGEALGTIREYRLLAKLGEGGMGTVYRAQHTKLKREVAIKVLPPDRVQSPEAIARFEREMQAVGKLDHPHIVRAFDAGVHDGRHYLVMEFVQGRDVSQLVPSGKTLAIADACEIVRQAAIGLAHAHEAGLVHRDIKPSNLLVNQAGVVKILDLGLARMGQEDNDVGELTSTGAIMGTIDYMAPEQATSTHDVDIRADIYSLGATLYRLLTGRAPFFGECFDTPMKKLLALGTKSPMPIRAIRPEVTGALASLIDDLLAKDPDDRPPTPADVAEALEPFCRGANLPRLMASLTPSFVESPARPAEPQSQRKTEASYSNPNADTAATMDRAASLPLRLGKDRDQSTAPFAPRRTGTGVKGAVSATRHRRPLVAAFSGRNFLRPVAIVAACGAAFALVLGVVFYLQTPEGTVRIEILDPDIHVAIEGGGKATFSGAMKNHKIVLQPGSHGITIARGDLTFGTTSFELKKGDKPRLRIEYIAGKVQVTKDGAPMSVTPKTRATKDGVDLPAAPQTTVAQAGWHGWPTDAPPPAIAPFDAAQATKHQAAWAKYLGVPVEWRNSLGMKFRLIPPGEFLMGAIQAEIDEGLEIVKSDKNYDPSRIRASGPQHRVILSQPIYLGVQEVSQGQYQELMGNNPSAYAVTGTVPEKVALVKGLDTTAHPVESVSWNDAAEFCAKLSGRESLGARYFRAGEAVTHLQGNGYRLPTEATWEFACRAGTTGRYWSGEREDDLAKVGWYGRNSGQRTHDGGALPPNPFGLYDVHGNVMEWCQDRWDPKIYGRSGRDALRDPAGPLTGTRRTARGGGWGNFDCVCRCATRYDIEPIHRAAIIGFRVAIAVEAVRERIATEGSALEFNGQDSYVDLPTLTYDGSHPITIEAWAMPSSSRDQGYSFVVSNVDDSFVDGEYWPAGIGLQQRALTRGATNCWGVWVSTNIPPTGENQIVGPQTQWSIQRAFHLALQLNDDRAQFYINGKLIENRRLNAAHRASKKHFTIGNRFGGRIREIHLSKIARYAADFKPQDRVTSDEHTLALYHFDEGQGDALTDSSGNNHHGKIVRAKWVPLIDASSEPD